MFKQPIELMLVKIELLSKTVLHFVTLIMAFISWDNQCSDFRCSIIVGSHVIYEPNYEVASQSLYHYVPCARKA